MPELTCKCPVCERTRKFKEIVAKLESDDDRTFMEGIMEELCTVEEDRDWLQCKFDDVQRNAKATS
jgi:bacterioferritin (cytochrome b1)